MWDMGEITMPGGWALSMLWFPMCGQTWAGAAASFIGMWAVMMVAMILPSWAPMLWRGEVAAWAGAGYAFVLTMLGVPVFALGAAFAQAVLQMPAVAHAVPVSLGIVVLLAGAYQLTPWKAHHLACCRQAAAQGLAPPAGARAAWRRGVRLGLHCSHSCAGLTAMLLVMGVMDLGAMALITAAITAERLAPAGERVARAVGVASIGTGLLLIARAA